MKLYEYLGCRIRIPANCNWVATDEDGEVFAYPREPRKIGVGWILCGMGTSWHIGTSPCEDWKDSLRHISELKIIQD